MTAGSGERQPGGIPYLLLTESWGGWDGEERKGTEHLSTYFEQPRVQWGPDHPSVKQQLSSLSRMAVATFERGDGSSY